MEQLQKYLSKPISMYVFQYSTVDFYDVDGDDLRYVAPGPDMERFVYLLIRLNRSDVLKRCNLSYWSSDMLFDAFVYAAIRDRRDICEYIMANIYKLSAGANRGSSCAYRIYRMLCMGAPYGYVYMFTELMSHVPLTYNGAWQYIDQIIGMVVGSQKYWMLRQMINLNMPTEDRYRILFHYMDTTNIPLPLPALALILGVSTGYLIIQIAIYLRSRPNGDQIVWFDWYRVRKVLSLVNETERNELKDILASHTGSYIYVQVAECYEW